MDKEYRTFENRGKLTTRRTLNLSRQWSRSLSITDSHEVVGTLESELGMKGVAKLGSKITTTSSHSETHRQAYTLTVQDQIEIEVPPKHLATLTIIWKNRVRHGSIEIPEGFFAEVLKAGFDRRPSIAEVLFALTYPGNLYIAVYNFFAVLLSDRETYTVKFELVDGLVLDAELDTNPLRGSGATVRPKGSSAQKARRAK